jgi:hypothetical protein
MEILANANNNIWKHHAGTIYALQKTERGVVGIQECKEQNGTLRRDIVFVEGSKIKGKVVRRGIIGGYTADGSADAFQYLVFWTNSSDNAIVSAQTLADAKCSFKRSKIFTEIIDLALDTFENFLQQLSAS